MNKWAVLLKTNNLEQQRLPTESNRWNVHHHPSAHPYQRSLMTGVATKNWN